MCNLYHICPPEHLHLFFDAVVTDPVPPSSIDVRPFGPGMFLRPSRAGELEAVAGQWGMIEPGATVQRPASLSILTHNARIETIAKRRTFRRAWQRGKRCLIPSMWYLDPDPGPMRSISRRMKTFDGSPWAIAGLWDEWAGPGVAKVVSSYTMINVRCNDHPLLGRQHVADGQTSAAAQGQRTIVHIRREDRDAWLFGTKQEALSLLVPAPIEAFDLVNARRADEVLAIGR